MLADVPVWWKSTTLFGLIKELGLILIFILGFLYVKLQNKKKFFYLVYAF